MIADEIINVKLIKLPEKIMIYLNQVIPFHKKYMPPKVNKIEINGSSIKNNLSFCGILVSEIKIPINKNIIDILKICECMMPKT